MTRQAMEEEKNLQSGNMGRDHGSRGRDSGFKGVKGWRIGGGDKRIRFLGPPLRNVEMRVKG